MSALIFDRTQADTDRAAYLIGKIQRREMLTEAEQAEYNAGLRGCYNITDLNRVEAKVRELAETLRSYGYSVDYKDRTYPVLSYVDTDYLVNAKWHYGADTYSYAALARDLIISGKKISGNSRVSADASNIAIKFTDYGIDLGESKSYAWKGLDSSTIVFVSIVLSYDGSDIAISNSKISVSDNKIYFCFDISEKIEIGSYVITINVKYSGTDCQMAIPFEIKEVVSDEWQYTDTMLESDVLLYLANIAALRDVIKLPPDVPPIPTPTMLGGQGRPPASRTAFMMNFLTPSTPSAGFNIPRRVMFSEPAPLGRTVISVKSSSVGM